MPRFATYDEGDEPIHGYKLVDFLGTGQFGEVWKTVDTASGRKAAMKIIDLSYSQSALKELRALKLVRNLNHPNLVPIYTARLIDKAGNEIGLDDAAATQVSTSGKPLKKLVIVMGLGEKSLAQRLKEENPDGTSPEEIGGLPLEELLGYMEGAAKGIDYLNRKDHGLGDGDGPIVHCDVKPDNMMIVGGEVQIADCGVAIIITPDARQTRAAGSPAYSPPELTGNKPGPGTDQYSLAISYYELRTGRLPFADGLGPYEVMVIHASSLLDFSCPAISDDERQVLRWATSKLPHERYPSCLDFVRQLRRVSEGLPPIDPSRLSRPSITPRSGGGSGAQILPSSKPTPKTPSSSPFPPAPAGSMPSSTVPPRRGVKPGSIDFDEVPPAPGPAPSTASAPAPQGLTATGPVSADLINRTVSPRDSGPVEGKNRGKRPPLVSKQPPAPSSFETAPVSRAPDESIQPAPPAAIAPPTAPPPLQRTQEQIAPPVAEQGLRGTLVQQEPVALQESYSTPSESEAAVLKRTDLAPVQPVAPTPSLGDTDSVEDWIKSTPSIVDLKNQPAVGEHFTEQLPADDRNRTQEAKPGPTGTVHDLRSPRHGIPVDPSDPGGKQLPQVEELPTIIRQIIAEPPKSEDRPSAPQPAPPPPRPEPRAERKPASRPSTGSKPVAEKPASRPQTPSAPEPQPPSTPSTGSQPALPPKTSPVDVVPIVRDESGEESEQPQTLPRPAPPKSTAKVSTKHDLSATVVPGLTDPNRVLPRSEPEIRKTGRGWKKGSEPNVDIGPAPVKGKPGIKPLVFAIAGTAVVGAAIVGGVIYLNPPGPKPEPTPVASGKEEPPERFDYAGQLKALEDLLKKPDVPGAIAFRDSVAAGAPGDWKPRTDALIRPVAQADWRKKFDAELAKKSEEGLAEAEKLIEKLPDPWFNPEDKKELVARVAESRNLLKDKALQQEIAQILDPLKKRPANTLKPEDIRSVLEAYRNRDVIRKDLAEQLIQQAESEPERRRAVVRGIYDGYPIRDLDAALKTKIAPWWVLELGRVEAVDLRQALAKLASDAQPSTITHAMNTRDMWKAVLNKTAADFGPSWNPNLLSDETLLLDQTADAWSQARTDLAPFRKFLLEKEPAEPLAMGKDYIRLATRTPLDPASSSSIRTVRDYAREHWKDRTASDALNADFQNVLAEAVRARVAEGKADPSTLQELCADDAANGWKSVALAEAMGKAPTEAIPAGDTDLAAYKDYVTALSLAGEPAAEAFSKAYSPDPRKPRGVLSAEVRKKTAADALVKMAQGELKPRITRLPDVIDDRSLAAERLRKAAEISSEPRFQVLASLTPNGSTYLRGLSVDRLSELTKDLSPRLSVVFALNMARAAKTTADQTIANAFASGPLVQWLEEEYDGVAPEGEKRAVDTPALSKEEKDNLVRTIGLQLKAMASNSGMNEAARSRILLARTRFLAEFSQSNKNDVAEGWSDSRESLDRLGNAATADNLGYAALLTYASFYFDHVDGKIPAAGKPIPENLADRWAKLFVWADQALAKDPNNSPANRALASAYAFLNSYPGMYRPIHEKATELARVVGKYNPDDLGNEIVKRYSIGLDSTTRKLPDLQYYVADLDFRATAREIIAGKVSPDKAKQQFESVLNRLKKAEQQGYSNRTAVLRIRSAALEDQAWQTPEASGADFAMALQAFKELEGLSRNAYDTNKTNANRIEWLGDLTGMGRCQYRAAAFDISGRFQARNAVQTLSEAFSRLKEFKDESPKDVNVDIKLIEATYFLGMAYWEDGQNAKAQSTLREALTIPGEKDIASHRSLAIIALSKVLRSMALKNADEAQKYVKLLNDLVDSFTDKTSDNCQFIEAIWNATQNKRDLAASQFVKLSNRIAREKLTDTERQSSELYQCTLAELTRLWEEGYFGETTATERESKKKDLQAAILAFPWRLTVAERKQILGH